MRPLHLKAAMPLSLVALLLASSSQLVDAFPWRLQESDQGYSKIGYRFIRPRQQVSTTTWTETNTFTSTITIPDSHPTGGSGEECQPQEPGWIPCGPVCCKSSQYCAQWGQCLDNGDGGGGGGGGGGVTTVTSDGETITTQYSAPFRPTSSASPTGDAASATTTGDGSATAIPGEGDDGDEGTGGGGLSAGAIAGIVIGSLVGIGLLMLLCFCCIARGLWGLLCGGRKKEDRRRERVDIVEERYRAGSRAPSAHSRRDTHGGWFSGFGRPSAAADRRDEEKKSSGAKWLGLGAAAATLLALLHLRRDKDKDKGKSERDRSRRSRSRYTDSYYSYTDSESSWDSRDRRTHLTSYLGSASSGGRTRRDGRSSRYSPRR